MPGQSVDRSMSTRSTSLETRKAGIPLNVIIIGASVAGLACAYSLCHAGHDVLVLESRRELAKSPGGVRIPPNMSRILLQWGLGREIARQTTGRCPKIVFNSGFTGENIGELVFHKKVMEALEGEVFLLHHSDLLLMLYNLACDAGARVSFGCRVVDIDINSEIPAVKLRSGGKLCADLIVAADGHQSIVRSVLPATIMEDQGANHACYMCTIPAALFAGDEELMTLVEEPRWNIWMGSEWALLGHPVRNNTEFAVTIFKNEQNADPNFDWNTKVSVSDINIEHFEFAPILRRLMRLAGDIVRIRDDKQSLLERWYDEKGHILVVGEAAHRLNPGSSHGAALAVEDAVVLGRLLSRLKSKDDMKWFMSSFQEIRQSRCENVRISEQQKVDFAAMPPGSLRNMRDHSMRMQKEQRHADWTGSSESYLRKSWEEFRDLFGYDAFDDAETWWVEWGVLFERTKARNKPSNSDFFDGQVTVERAQHVINLI